MKKNYSKASVNAITLDAEPMMSNSLVIPGGDDNLPTETRWQELNNNSIWDK